MGYKPGKDKRENTLSLLNILLRGSLIQDNFFLQSPRFLDPLDFTSKFFIIIGIYQLSILHISKYIITVSLLSIFKTTLYLCIIFLLILWNEIHKSHFSLFIATRKFSNTVQGTTHIWWMKRNIRLNVWKYTVYNVYLKFLIVFKKLRVT